MWFFLLPTPLHSSLVLVAWHHAHRWNELFKNSAACMFAPLGVSVDALPRLNRAPRHVWVQDLLLQKPWWEGSSLDSSSGRPGSAYFIGQKTSSHSRRFNWLLLYCHDSLARWPYSGNLLWKCLCGQCGRATDKLRMQWLVWGVTDAVFRQPETVSGWKVCLGHS